VISKNFFGKFVDFAMQCRRETGRSYFLLPGDLFRVLLRGLFASEYFGMPLFNGLPDRYLKIRDGIRVERVLNPRMTGVINFDKWQQYCFFKANGLSSPDVYGFVCGERLLVLNDTFSRYSSTLVEALGQLSCPFAVKPYGGGHGIGFDVVDSIDVKSETVSFRRRGVVRVAEWLEEVSKDAEGLLFQQLVASHSELLVFGQSALNTLRIVTIRDAHGIAHPAVVLMKLARVGALVDNIGAGALAAHVHLETGRLSKAFVWPGLGVWERHPDTDAQIEGFEVPFWREGLELATRAHERLTSADSLSWDIAITDEGPVLLEMNAFTPRPVYQRLNRGLLGTVYGEVLRQRKLIR
jgi:hypothetical protein